ncbi:glutathione S-transferase C-terminal domain-containing protein-like [Clytia hemisphaerica]
MPTNEEEIKHVSFTEKSGNPKQVHAKITKALPTIKNILEQHRLNSIGFGENNENKTISWEDFPNEVDPSGGELNPDRSKRKRQQIENMVSRILPLLRTGDKIVEFCAGGGHLGIVVAYLRPDCQVVLLDNKEESMNRACSRIKSLGLKNVTFYLTNLEYYNGSFDIGTTLHACGTATDLVLKKCINDRSSFVIAPCCYGGIRSTTDILYPKSTKFKCLEPDFYHILAHSADQTNNNPLSEYNIQGKNSMILVDLDRKLHAMEKGNYNEIDILTMDPVTCSPKNNMIVGTMNR